MPIRAWSKVAADNDDADIASGIDWREGMAPGQVNNSDRAEMAEIAELLSDNDGTLTTAGSSTVYTVTNNGSFEALADGVELSITIDETCGASPTLNVNGLGAKKFRKFAASGETDLAAGDLVANGHYSLEYDASADSGAGAWIVLNPTQTIPPILHVRDEKTSGTGGGSAISGNQTRILNTVVTNGIAGASLATNQITLPAGTYEISARVPGQAVQRHKAWLRNVSADTVVVLGSSTYSNPTNASQTDSWIVGRFTLGSSTALDIRHNCQTASATEGLGSFQAIAGVNELYTSVFIRKVA